MFYPENYRSSIFPDADGRPNVPSSQFCWPSESLPGADQPFQGVIDLLLAWLFAFFVKSEKSV